jgi:cell division protein DivIC
MQTYYKKITFSVHNPENLSKFVRRMNKMRRLSPLLSLLGHYKYVITIVVGVLLVGVIDDNSFVHRAKLEMQISDLEADIERYNEQNEADVKQLKAMKSSPKAFERIARERYFMKADDEDIFVLSDDEQPKQLENETTE